MASVTWDPGIKSSNPTITMTVNQTSQSTANNTSTVSWSLVIKRPYAVSSVALKPYSVVIDGVTVASGSTSIAGSGDKTIASGTRTISHASNGTKTLSFSFSVTVMPLKWSGVDTGNASGSGSMTLTTIPRYTTISSFSATVGGPSSISISWTAADTCNYWWYSLNNGSSWVAVGTINASSGSRNITGLSENTTYNVRVRVRRSSSNLTTDSGNLARTTEYNATSITAFSTSAIERDRLTVSWTAAHTCNYWWYSLNGGTNWTAVGNPNSTSASRVISGLAAGTTYTVRVKVRRSAGNKETSSGNLSRTTLAIAAPNTPTLSSNTCIQAVMNWSSNRTVTGLQYRLAGGAWQTAITFTARTSGSFTVTGLTPGYTRTVSIRVRDAVHGTWSGASGNITVTSYALTTAAAPTFNTDATSLSVTLNRSHSSITSDVTLQFYHDNQTWYDLTPVNDRTTSVSLPISSYVSTIYSGRKAGKTARTRLKMVSKWSGTTQGTSYSPEGTVTIVNANPTLSGVSYKDINSTVVQLLGNNQKILRNKSELSVIAGTATAQKSATLSSYKVSIGGHEKTESTNSTNETGKTINLGKINLTTSEDVVLTVTDSRGNSVSKKVNVDILNYIEPMLIQAVGERKNNYEEESYLVLEARRSIVKPVNEDINEIYMRYRIKESEEIDFGSYKDITSTNTDIIDNIYQNISVRQNIGESGEEGRKGYPNHKSYIIEVQIKDKFSANWGTPYLLTLPEGIALMKYFRDRIEIGVPIKFGPYSIGLNTEENTLDIIYEE